MLRQGRVYAVSVAESGAAEQVDSIRVAIDSYLNSGVWYDEMLVRGRTIYVIGYLPLADFDAHGDQDLDDDHIIPIFLRDDVFALMGSELQQVQAESGALDEVGERVVLAP